MSTFTILKRGVIQLVNGDVSPKEIALPSAVRSETALLVAGPIKDRRRDVSVQAARVSLTDASVSPMDIAITSVDVAATEIALTLREDRADGKSGVTAYLTSATNLRLEFAIGAGDTVQVAYEVRERKARRGVILRIKDDENLEALWDGTLAAGETIDLAYNVIDFDDVANAILELDYKQLRTLGYLGENQILDQVTRETPGNQVTYRLRVFNSKANAESATLGYTGDDFETGELSRVDRTIEIDIRNNDRESMIRVLSKLADTPGIEA